MEFGDMSLRLKPIFMQLCWGLGPGVECWLEKNPQTASFLHKHYPVKILITFCLEMTSPQNAKHDFYRGFMFCKLF